MIVGFNFQRSRTRYPFTLLHCGKVLSKPARIKSREQLNDSPGF